MISTDIIGIGLPDSLATGRARKANPDQNIIAMRAQRVARTRAVQRQIEEVAIEVRIIDRLLAQDHRDVGVQAIRRAAFLNDDRPLKYPQLASPSPGPPPESRSHTLRACGTVVIRPDYASLWIALHPA
jgi:hypothetical protein